MPQDLPLNTGPAASPGGGGSSTCPWREGCLNGRELARLLSSPCMSLSGRRRISPDAACRVSENRHYRASVRPVAQMWIRAARMLMFLFLFQVVPAAETADTWPAPAGLTETDPARLAQMAEGMLESNPRECARLGELALDLPETGRNPTLELRVRATLCAAYLKLSDLQKALAHGLQGESLGDAAVGPEALCSLLFTVGGVYMKLGDHDKALERYLRMLRVAESTGQRRHIFTALRYIGFVQVTSGNSELALESLQRSLQYAERQEDQQEVIGILTSLGMAYTSLGRFDDALASLERARALTAGSGDVSSRGEILNEIGAVCLMRGQLPEALKAFKESLACSRDQPDPLSRRTLLINIGTVQMGLKQYAAAERSYREALDVSTAAEDKQGVHSALCRLGVLCLNQNRPAQAEAFFKRSLELARSVKSNSLVAESLATLAAFSADRGDFQRAYGFQSELTDIRQQLFNAESASRFAEMRTRFETARAEEEIELLKRDRAIQGLEVSRQRWMLWAIGGGLALLAALALVLASRYRLQQSANSEIRHRNEQLRDAFMKMEQMAATDALTGLANRREILRELKRETHRAERNARSFVVVIGDIDNFKGINDRHGHQTGDVVLAGVARVMRESLRKQDLVGRWGGEEFIMVLPETSLANGVHVAETMRRRIADIQLEEGGQPVRITMTFGLCEYPGTDDDIDAVILRADAALYAGKRNGKNQVVPAGPKEYNIRPRTESRP